MTLQEWANSSIVWQNELTNTKVKNYLLGRFGNHDLLFESAIADGYFRSQLLVHENLIKKMTFLEAKYEQVWNSTIALDAKTTTESTGSNIDSNMGYNVDTPFFKSNMNQNLTNTQSDILRQLNEINSWVMIMLPKFEVLVNGMINTLRGYK